MNTEVNTYSPMSEAETAYGDGLQNGHDHGWYSAIEALVLTGIKRPEDKPRAQELLLELHKLVTD